MSGPSPLALAHRLVADLRFGEAAAQFGLAADQTEDVGAKKTLKALQAQNDRKALDAARRQQQQAEASTSAAAAAAAAASPSPHHHHHRSSSSSPTPKAHKHRSRGTSELRKELLTPPPPFAIASSPSPPPSSTTGPAAVSPRGSTSLIRQAAERARTQRHLEISRIDDGAGRDGAGSSRGAGGGAGLTESTTWSRGGESSYLFPPRERSDPFQRFWGVVEGMLEDYSNPVAFASAPLGSVLDGRTGRSGTSLRRSVTTPAKLEHPRDPQRAPVEDPHDSFYLVSPQSSTASSFGSLDDFPASAKTSEELQLENMSLRLSLDKLASHTHALEQRLAALSSSTPPAASASPTPTSAPASGPPLTKSDARAALGLGFTPSPGAGGGPGPPMAPVDLGRLKKEVEKVWRGEESRVLEMSRVLQAQAAGAGAGSSSSSAADQRRIGELERLVGALRDESAKQREMIAKYRGRLERIKVGARKKRDERGREEGQPAAGEDLEGEGDG